MVIKGSPVDYVGCPPLFFCESKDEEEQDKYQDEEKHP